MDLTSLSQTARKAIILAVVGIFALIIIRIVYGLAVSFVKSLTPPPPPQANQLFGALTPIKFDQPFISSSKFTYVLETVDSKLPSFGQLFNVYPLKQTPALFQSLDQAKTRVGTFGFKEQPTQISANIYQWQDSNQPGYTLTMDIVSGDFRLVLNPSLRSELLTGKVTFDTTEAINRARNYLKNHSVFSSSFDKGDAQVQFLNITAKQTTVVSSADQANAFRVDFYPSKVDEKYQILTQKPDATPLNVTLLQPAEQNQEFPFEINYQQFEIDLDTKGSYQIKNSAAAWEQLKEGQAVVLRNSKLGGQISINSISLGYFKETKTKYLKPVYIFEGASSVDQVKNDFTAVLPAIAVEGKGQ